MSLSFFLLTILIGELLQAPMAFITALWGFTVYSIKSTLGSLYQDFKTFGQKRKYRKQLTRSKTHLKIWMDKHTNDPPDLGSSFPLPPKVGTNGLKIIKPEGPVAHNPKKKQVLIEKIKISEVSCKLIENRPFIPVLLSGEIEHLALMDSGAQSSSISPRLLEKIEKFTILPREKRPYKVTGIIQGASSEGDEVVILSFKIASGYEVRNIPCIVLDTGTDLLFGSNVIVEQRWGSEWQGDKLFYKLGYNGPSVEAFFLPNTTVKAITMSSMVLMPNEKKIVPLTIPEVGGFKNTNFHKSDLIATSLYEEDLKGPGLEITPCISRLGRKQNRFLAEIVNKTGHPIAYDENTEVAQVQMFQNSVKNPNLFDVTTYRQTKYVFEHIPRVAPGEDCYCKLKGDVSNVLIQLADRYGLTSTTNNFLSCLPHEDAEFNNIGCIPLEPLKPGLVIKKQRLPGDMKQCDAFYTILVIPDENGKYTAITTEHIEETKKELEKDMATTIKKKPTFFFLDPLSEISYSTMTIMVDIYLQFGFHFFPVRFIPDHKGCVHMSMQQVPPEILTGSQVTRLHIQKGSIPPPEDLMRKNKGTPVFRTKLLGATLLLFRLGIFFTCHLHLPPGIEASPDKILWRDRIFYITLNELRKLRVPTDFQITIDGNPDCPTARQETEAYAKIVNDNLNRLPSFLEPSERCNFMVQESMEEDHVYPVHSKLCICVRCKDTTNPGVLYLFEGSLFKPREKRVNICSSS